MPAAGEKVLRTLHHDAELFEVLRAQRARTARDQNALGADNADARHAQQRFIVRAVHLDGEELGMAQRPAALGVKGRIKVRRVVVEQLVCAKAVKPQQPVGLIEPVLAQQRRLGVERGQKRVLDYRHIG